MSQYMYLNGAEDVQRAARSIASSAHEIRQSAMNIDGTREQFQRYMDDWLCRLEGLVERLETLGGIER